MKSENGINFLNEVVGIKKDAESLVRELNTFLTEDNGIGIKFHTWKRIKDQIKELAKAVEI